MKGYGIKSSSLRLMLSTMLSADVPAIRVSQALAQMPNAVFLDSREKEEYNISHLPGAIWIGYNDFQLSRLQDIATSQSLIVYCSIGKRSDAITKKLRSAGYLAAQNLAGGIFEWVNQGNAVYSGGEQTTAVHVYNPFWGRWLKKGQKVF